MTVELVPAAQYLRMSTDHQQYSLDNQADAIALYAVKHRFTIVKTYSDAAKSGLRLGNRGGLKQLLTDVVEGATFRAVLVFDVSRWGRFRRSSALRVSVQVCGHPGSLLCRNVCQRRQCSWIDHEGFETEYGR